MKYIIILILFSALVFGEQCEYLFNRYNIDPKIKSVKGWKRVIKHGKLHFYIRHEEYINDVDDEEKISKCLVGNGFEMETYNRLIGKKL